ncbi:hypothetical protein NSTCB13_03431 [Nostoc sp. DSM 114160]|jgi:hypothetical protein
MVNLMIMRLLFKVKLTLNLEIKVRPPLKRRSNNPSPLKWTVILGPLSEDFCYQTGILIPGGGSV